MAINNESYQCLISLICADCVVTRFTCTDYISLTITLYVLKYGRVEWPRIQPIRSYFDFPSSWKIFISYFIRVKLKLTQNNGVLLGYICIDDADFKKMYVFSVKNNYL